MAWFKSAIKSIFKISSKNDIKNRALQQLQQGADPQTVAIQLIDEMSQTDNTFSYSPEASLIVQNAWSADSLIETINSIQTEESLPISPTSPVSPLSTQQSEIIDTQFEDEPEETGDEIEDEIEETEENDDFDMDIKTEDIIEAFEIEETTKKLVLKEN